MESSDLPLIRLKILALQEKLKKFNQVVDYVDYVIPDGQRVSDDELTYFNYNFQILKKMVDKAMRDIEDEFILNFEEKRNEAAAKADLKKHQLENPNEKDST